jgi:hypothetical protein
MRQSVRHEPAGRTLSRSRIRPQADQARAGRPASGSLPDTCGRRQRVRTTDSVRYPSSWAGFIRTASWSVCGVVSLSSSTVRPSAGPNQCGLRVSNSAISPGRSVESSSSMIWCSAPDSMNSPFVAVVRHQQRFARREHLPIDLQLAWVVREQHDDAAAAPRHGPQMDPGSPSAARTAGPTRTPPCWAPCCSTASCVSRGVGVRLRG